MEPISPAGTPPISEIERSMHDVTRKNKNFRIWATIALFAIFTTLLGTLFGIYEQNRLATDIKNHDDCIVKLFSQPLPADKKSRYISDPNDTCGIKFTN